MKTTCIYQVSSSNLPDSMEVSHRSSAPRHYAVLADAQKQMRRLMKDIGRAHNRALLKDKGYTVDMEWTGKSAMTYVSGFGPVTQKGLRLSEHEEKWEAWEHGYQVQIVSIAVREKFNGEEE